MQLGEELKDWFVSVAIAVVLAFFIRHYVVELYVVEGPSMRPTLQSGERLVVNKFIYRFQQPQRGEVVVFRYPFDQRRDFIKRVIAVAGDQVEIRDGLVMVNGRVLNEPYIRQPTRGIYPAALVPPGHIFVLGDNRNNSEDSRFPDVGFVPLDLVEGRAVLVFWPTAYIKVLSAGEH